MTDNRVRVGFVVHQMQIAGAEILISQIIVRLKDEIAPTIFCLDAIGELGSKLAEQGVPVVVLDRKPGIDQGLPFRLAKEIKSRSIEVVHAHQYTPFFYTALARLTGCWATKIVFTEHGRHFPDIVSWKRRLANRFILSQFSNVTTACCDFSTVALKQKEGFSRAFTIPNGVAVEDLPPRGTPDQQRELRTKLGLCNDLQYVACVARFHPIKDHAMLLRAWAIVQMKVPNARLILVGDGSERAAMEELSRTLRLETSVQFWGIRHDIGDILRAVDLFALSSISEASSLTLLEAMACECPVVATDVGGNSEHFTHGVEGYLVPRGGSREMGEKLTKLLRNDEAREQMGSFARRRVVDKFDLKVSVARYHEIYTQWSKDRGV